jgi:multiple antibiotic resistance protein
MSSDIFHDFLLILVPLAVAVDAPGTLPLFVAITAHKSVAVRKRLAVVATLVAAGVGIGFFILGEAIFSFLGIQVADFQIAGGVLLLILTVLDLLSPGKPSVDERGTQEAVDHDVTQSLFPLAVPLIVGPATLTTGLLLVTTYSKSYGHPAAVVMVSLALLLNLALLMGMMYASDRLVKLIGKPAMGIMNKIVMILLAAIAVSLIRAGVVTIVRELIGKG